MDAEGAQRDALLGKLIFKMNQRETAEHEERKRKEEEEENKNIDVLVMIAEAKKKKHASKFGKKGFPIKHSSTTVGKVSNLEKG